MSLTSQDLYLPVQTLLVEAQLQLAETLLKVFEEYDLELRESRSKRQQKSCIEKVRIPLLHAYSHVHDFILCLQMIDDFVREAPNLTALDEEWNSTARCSVATAQNG